MDDKSLDFKIILKIPDAELEITDLDIDIDITKSYKSDANKAEVTVWNLDKTVYQKLKEQKFLADICTCYGEEEPVVAFRGYIDSIRNIKLQDDTAVDIPVVIELADGREAYTNARINKDYRTQISSTTIIKDCISSMGLGIGKFSDTLPEKIYAHYKAKGKPHVILQKITKPLGINFSIQNNMIQVIAPDEEAEEAHALILNSENSQNPKDCGEDAVLIRTGFVPYANPNDSVRCEFKEFEGTMRIKHVHSWGNNYGTAVTTDIII